MPRTAATNQSSSLGRLLFLVALLGFLSLPVEYRAGADLPHPHASFQLWLDAARGAPDHHHAEAGSKSAPPHILAAARNDAPRLAEVTISFERFPLLVATAVVGLLLSAWWHGAPWGIVRAVFGLPPRPEPPPPRRGFVPC